MAGVEGDSFELGVDAELGEHGPDLGAHGGRRDHRVRGDGRGALAGGEQLEDFALPAGQGWAAPQIPDRCIRAFYAAACWFRYSLRTPWGVR